MFKPHGQPSTRRARTPGLPGRAPHSRRPLWVTRAVPHLADRIGFLRREAGQRIAGAARTDQGARVERESLLRPWVRPRVPRIVPVSGGFVGSGARWLQRRIGPQRSADGVMETHSGVGRGHGRVPPRGGPDPDGSRRGGRPRRRAGSWPPWRGEAPEMNAEELDMPQPDRRLAHGADAGRRLETAGPFDRGGGPARPLHAAAVSGQAFSGPLVDAAVPAVGPSTSRECRTAGPRPGEAHRGRSRTSRPVLSRSYSLRFKGSRRRGNEVTRSTQRWRWPYAMEVLITGGTPQGSYGPLHASTLERGGDRAQLTNGYRKGLSHSP
jgi:hypothetical protein